MVNGMRNLTKTLLVLLSLAIAGPAWADFKRDYGNAVKAIGSGKWDKAAEGLRSAISENPDSAERLRLYGMRFDVYMPHYYLGEALFQQGDCAGAVAAWDEAISRGVIQTQDQFGEMQSNMSSCSGSVVDVSAIAATATGAINALDAAAKGLAELKGDAAMGSSWSTFESGLNGAQRQVASLGNRLRQAQADKDADAIEAIEREAGQGTANINALISQARSTLEVNRVAASRAANSARQEMLCRQPSRNCWRW
jgi:tetratricopeptide (TPR) repeat protein